MQIGNIHVSPGYPEASRQLLNYLFSVMKIDDAWSVREEDRFTWWGAHLAQRVSIDPVSAVNGIPAVSIRIESDFLRNVPDTEQTAKLIDGLNHFASLSAFVWDKQRGEVKLTCALRCDADNVESLKPLLAGAMAIQAADAFAGADRTASQLQCEAAYSSHPVSGFRYFADDMLSVRETVFAAKSDQPSPITQNEFARVAAWLKDRVLATHDEDGLTVEFPFWGWMPVCIQKFLGRKPLVRLTSLVQVTRRDFHPILGKGLLLLLRLPVILEADLNLHLPRLLNVAEATRWMPFSQLGGWCWDPAVEAPTFVAFVPELIYRPGTLEWHIQHLELRSAWARQFLIDELGFATGPPEIPPSAFDEQTSSPASPARARRCCRSSRAGPLHRRKSSGKKGGKTLLPDPGGP